MATLPLSGIVDVNVITSPIETIRSAFNTALIIGDSAVISTATRVKSYIFPSEMLTDGFLEDDEEYMAAVLYFAQTPTPNKIFVGVKGAVESLFEAVVACREANADWYVVIPVASLVTALTDETATVLAATVESMKPSTVLAYTFTNPITALARIGSLQVGKYGKTISMYDDNADNVGKTAIAGIIGFAMGSNFEGSRAFTLAYKPIVGLSSIDTLTSAEVEAILDANGNLYLSQAAYYNLFRQGKMASGVSFDEVMYLDMLVEKIKFNIMLALTSAAKIPQTNEGINILTNAIENACEESVDLGFIAPGVWRGSTILNLKLNDALSKGYLVQFVALERQTQADREARLAPTCYVCIKTAGAIEHVAISVTVNR